VFLGRRWRPFLRRWRDFFSAQCGSIIYDTNAFRFRLVGLGIFFLMPQGDAPMPYEPAKRHLVPAPFFLTEIRPCLCRGAHKSRDTMGNYVT
jgi:hypothetical protein